MKLLLVASLLLALSALLVATGTSTHPDVIFLNANIYTQATPARVQAMAVRDEKVVAVGGNDEITKLADKNTKIVDLGGHFVMPGFNDAHLHLASGGFEKMNVNLVGAQSLQEMQQRIAQRASQGRRYRVDCR